MNDETTPGKEAHAGDLDVCAGDVRVENVPDPKLREATDAVVRVLGSCVCGSDLWPYGSMPASLEGRRMGHEFLGVVEGTPVKLPVGEDSAVLPSLLTLSDVFCTGHHGVVTARVGPGKSDGVRHADAQHHPHGWRGAGPRLHRATAARHPRRGD
jgi:hypothetical protein